MRKKSLLTLTTILLMSLFFTSTALAYNFTGQSWPKTAGSTYTVNVKYATTSTTYRSTFDSAVSDWNSAQSKIKFNLSALNLSTLSTVGTQNVDDASLYGECTWSYDSGTNKISYFNAVINIGNSNIVNKANTRRSAAGHELGHALGLDHPSVLITSIMNSSRDRETIYTPQTDDKNGINAFYPL